MQLRDSSGRSMTECLGCTLELKLHLPSKAPLTASCSAAHPHLPTASGVLDCSIPVGEGAFTTADTRAGWCHADGGASYRGTASTTVTGRTCRRSRAVTRALGLNTGASPSTLI